MTMSSTKHHGSHKTPDDSKMPFYIMVAAYVTIKFNLHGNITLE